MQLRRQSLQAPRGVAGGAKRSSATMIARYLRYRFVHNLVNDF
jgi:hypothetical protein